MLGRNRIRKIENLFNIKFEVFVGLYKDYKCGYIAYWDPVNGIMIYIYYYKICVSFKHYFKSIRNKEFNKVLQLIHEYLYDSRDYN